MPLTKKETIRKVCQMPGMKSDSLDLLAAKQFHLGPIGSDMGQF